MRQFVLGLVEAALAWWGYGKWTQSEVLAKPGERVEKGQVLGWIEGFKAVTDVYSPISGTFEGANPALTEDIDLLSSRLYDQGWLFALRGEPDEDCLELEGYVGVLDATIDRMLGEEGQG